MYGPVYEYDWVSELTIGPMPMGLSQYSEDSMVTKVHCSVVTIPWTPLPTAHHLHCDIHTQLLDAVVPPIHPFLQQLLLLHLDAVPQLGLCHGFSRISKASPSLIPDLGTHPIM